MIDSPVTKRERPFGLVLFAIVIGLALLITGMVMNDALSTLNQSGVARAATAPANCGMNAKTYLEVPAAARFQLEADAVCK